MRADIDTHPPTHSHHLFSPSIHHRETCIAEWVEGGWSIGEQRGLALGKSNGQRQRTWLRRKGITSRGAWKVKKKGKSRDGEKETVSDRKEPGESQRMAGRRADRKRGKAAGGRELLKEREAALASGNELINEWAILARSFYFFNSQTDVAFRSYNQVSLGNNQASSCFWICSDN